MTEEISEIDTDTDDTAAANAAAEEAFASLTEDDIRERSQELHDAQELWETLAITSTPKIACPECSGRGSVGSGSLGDICVRCMGRRVIDAPGSAPIEMPPFAELRAAIGAYGDALADQALPPGHRAKKNLALPAASTVPTMDALRKLGKDGLARSRQLADARPLSALPAARDRVEGNDLTENEDTEIDDAELDDLEDAAVHGAEEGHDV